MAMQLVHCEHQRLPIAINILHIPVNNYLVAQAVLSDGGQELRGYVSIFGHQCQQIFAHPGSNVYFGLGPLKHRFG